MSEIKSKTIVFAGGGTGGHLYPALAMAEQLLKKNPHCKIHFVGTKKGLEARVIPKYNFPLHFIDIGPLNTPGLLKKIKTILLLPIAFFQAWFLVLKLKPSVVVGVGGYVSGPFLFVATLFRVKTLLWEPNAFPGMANRLLAGRVDECMLVFEEASKKLRGKKVSSVGMPVREGIDILSQKNKSVESRPAHIFVFGGSQGARAINLTMIDLLSSKDSLLSQSHIFHQTGILDFEKCSEALNKNKKVWPNYEVSEYVHDMEKKYQWADIVICRAGASTIAELAAARVPAVLIPYPHAADDHQLKNAMALAIKGAVEVLEQKNLTAITLSAAIKRILENPLLQKNMAESLKEFYKPGAAEAISEKILEGL